MRAVKKGSSKPRSSRSPALPDAVRWLWGPGRTWILLILILGLFFGGWYWAWRSSRDKVIAQSEYRLIWQNVELTPLPDWIHTDLRAEIFRDASLDDPQHPLSLMDDDLVERVKSAFSLHPWIARVVRVEKFYPGRVVVDVVYRHPVCMVEVLGELLPVDVEGVVLPKEDFSSVELSRYPRLAKIESRPLGPEGTRWGDARVVGGAEIAGALFSLWDKMDLDRIEPAKTAESSRDQDQTYELVTRKGTWVFWGRAPGAGSSGEPSAAEKTAKLAGCLAEHGTLEGAAGPNRLDLTRPGSIEVPSHATTNPGSP